MDAAQDLGLGIADLGPNSSDAPSDAGDAYRAALECLHDANVRHALLRDDFAALDRVRDLDLLIHPADRRLAVAALARAGFLCKRDRRLRKKWVFLRCDHGRFDVLDVHAACVQNGIEYMSASGALSRLDRSGPAPRLCAEDRFLHLLLHNLLGKPALQEKHVAPLLELHRAGLDPARLDDQARAFGLRPLVRVALAELETLLADPALWRRMRVQTRRALLRRPANRIGAWRYRHGDRLRWRRRPIVLALLGPDGSGKTSFTDALESLLHGTPLQPGRVYMGCWGHDLLPMRQARRLVPPQVSHTRLFWRRCGMPLRLSPAEQEMAAGSPSLARLAASAGRYALKNLAFHVALAGELWYRYLRHIAFSRRPLVLTDRYIYDLEFRQGKTPYIHGRWFRALWYRFFPAPDGILYLTTPYDLVAVRKPQLDRAQYETMDHVFRAVLRRHHPLLLVSDAPPDAMARAFLTHHWEAILERCNRRA